MKIYKAIQKILFVFFIIVLIGVVLLLFLNIRPAVVLSGSMEPDIATGSVVFIDREYKPTEIKKGDVIAFKNGDMTIIHRVVEKTSDVEYITKGDANKTEDFGSVKIWDIEGIVIFDIPKAGYIIMFLKNPLGLIAVIIFIGVFIMLGRIFVDTPHS